MSTDVKELEKKALQLPEKDRAKLAEHLIRSLDTQVDPDVERAWLEESERRYRAYLEGNSHALDAEDVFRDARAKLE